MLSVFTRMGVEACLNPGGVAYTEGVATGIVKKN